jgi:tetratricopeptide (TPR) repeat protein
MDRLAKLAASARLRPQLLAALDTLEKTHHYAKLPALFATNPGDATELAYLDDALASSLTQLIRDLGADARCLLWLIAMANQPESLELVQGVWMGEDGLRQAQLQEIKGMLAILPQLPAEAQAKLQAMPPEFRAMLDALPPQVSARPEVAPLLRRLVSVGLVTEERRGPDSANPDLTCHELVRERIRAWMAEHAEDQAGLTAEAIRLAYAERLEGVFKGLLHRDMTAALRAGSRALVYCCQAGAWQRLGGFTSRLVTSTHDPRLLLALLPHLQAAVDSAPEGETRWSCLGYLADALRKGGRPDASLPFYEQAATQARGCAEAGGDGARQAWANLAWISGNWANALGDVGDLGGARQRYLDSAEAEKKVGSPAIYVLASEVEALRLDIIQGQAATALPEVETRLARVQGWWQQYCSGQAVAQAPDAEFLARVFIGALDIATDAHFAREEWPAALGRLDTILEVQRVLQRPTEDIGATRMNRANVLVELPGRFGEAKAELEACLQLFHNDPACTAMVLSSLATLFARQGDLAQAVTQERRALALCEQLPNPADRAASHHNLATYLEQNGTVTALAASSGHQLAALLYHHCAGLGQALQTSLHNYTVRFRRAQAAGTVLAVPRVADLLADPAFAPLAQWLCQHQVDLGELQTAVDKLLDQARQVAVAAN